MNKSDISNILSKRNRLSEGMVAPDFNAEDCKGNLVSLKSFRGKKVALLFYRYAGCPFCQLHFHNFVAQYPRYAEHGLNTIAFVQSPKSSIAKYLPYDNIPFPIVSDPNKAAYVLYGVESSIIKSLHTISHMPFSIGTMLVRQGKIDGDINLIPAGFLLDENGIIKKAHYGEDYNDQISLDDVHSFLYEDTGITT